MMANGLKLCLCGSEPHVRTDDNNRYWLVKCEECGCATVHCLTREEAIEVWNKGEA